MATPMKEGLNRSALKRLADNLQRADSSFDRTTFLERSSRGLSRLELKERVVHVAEALRSVLPEDYKLALGLLVRSAKDWQRGDEKDPLRGFAAWPVFTFIELYGLSHFEASLRALRTLTPLFTAEFALRPYLEADPERTIALLGKWTLDPSEHVRRLVSEGTRPRLPWARRVRSLESHPQWGLQLLEELKDDPSEYVRRSIGNHLNDVAKEHPDLVLEICQRWLEGGSAERRSIVERATRTLVKEGHPGVWPLLGYPNKATVDCSDLELRPEELTLGGSLQLSCRLRNVGSRPQKLAIDYALHFVKASGERRPKVFKLKVLTLQAGEQVEVNKQHTIKAITTRKYYPGTHMVELFINGQSQGQASFLLNMP